MPPGLRFFVPAKTTSFISPPRRDFARCSPSTHEIASETFDLPQPLGPTTAVIPLPVKTISVWSANDLKPEISRRWSLNILYSAFLRGKHYILYFSDAEVNLNHLGTNVAKALFFGSLVVKFCENVEKEICIAANAYN